MVIINILVTTLFYYPGLFLGFVSRPFIAGWCSGYSYIENTMKDDLLNEIDETQEECV